MKQTILGLLLLLCATFLCAQDAGANIYVGYTQGQFTNQLYSPADAHHKGYLIMVDARLSEGPSYMIAGVGFNKVNMVSGTSSYLEQDFSLNWLKLRSGIGFKLAEILSHINIHAELLVSVDALTDYPSVVTPLPTSDLNNYSFGATARVKLFVSMFSVGLEYEKGLTDLVPDQGLGTSKFNNWALTTGIFF